MMGNVLNCWNASFAGQAGKKGSLFPDEQYRITWPTYLLTSLGADKKRLSSIRVITELLTMSKVERAKKGKNSQIVEKVLHDVSRITALTVREINFSAFIHLR